MDISPKPKSLQSEKNFAFLQCNLLESDSPAKVIKDCLETYGERIDALLNVAGMMDTNNSVDTLEDAAWDRIIALNLTAPVKLMREVVPVMLKQGGGSIVNVSSKAGLSGAVAGVAYTSSKHGLVSVPAIRTKHKLKTIEEWCHEERRVEVQTRWYQV